MRTLIPTEPIALRGPPIHVLGPASGRRCHAGDICLDARKLMEFNQRLARCIAGGPDIDADSLSCLARRLLRQQTSLRHPSCVKERLRCAAAMEMMLRDLGWEPEEPAARISAEVIAYLRSNDQQLIPNGAPVVGRLDDAILIDRAWPVAEREILLCCDFRRLRQIEAELRGTRPDRLEFTRHDFDQARLAEVQLYRTQRRIGLGSYTRVPTRVDGPLIP